MPEHRRCFLILQVALFGGVSLGTGNVSVSGCQGDSVELYSNIKFNINFTVVSVYKNGVHSMLIAVWTTQDSRFNSTFLNEYSDRLFLDKNGSVWIHRLHISDEAEYTIKIDTGNESFYSVVQLDVLVAPTTNCKPKIKRLVNVLTVYLETTGCGRPAASVYWLNHSGIFHADTKAIELQPGKQDGIYYACIKGDALRCIKSSQFSEYCDFLKVVDDQTSLKQERTRDGIYNTARGMVPINTSAFFMILILPLSLTCTAMCIVICILVFRKNKGNRNREPVNEAQLETITCGDHLPVIEFDSSLEEGADELLSDHRMDEIYPLNTLQDSAFSIPLPIEEEARESKGEHEIEGTLPKVPETTRRGLTERYHNEDGWLKEHQ